MSRRPSFTREERIAKGLEVCRTPTCPRAPTRQCRGWCGGCFKLAPRLRSGPAQPRALLQAQVRPDLVLAVRLEAERRGVTQRALLEEVLMPIAKTWGAPT
jgi:hypothetical protein